VNWVDGLNEVEVVIVGHLDEWVAKVAAHDHLGVLVVPGCAMAASWIVFSVDQIMVVARRLELVGTLKLHGVK
jgi:hypothetical protein